MKYIIEDDYLIENNISMSIEKMPNTEIRYRLKIDENTLYSITKSGDKLSWQNSHYHKYCNELYIVQKGKLVMITKDNNKICSKVMKRGEIINIQPNVSHNLYMIEDTEICVLKYGDIKPDDWYCDKSLDNICRKMDVTSIK